MKKIVLGLVIALAAPLAAHAAEPAHKSCCENMKDGCCCCDKTGENHAEHKDMQH